MQEAAGELRESPGKLTLKGKASSPKLRRTPCFISCRSRLFTTETLGKPTYETNRPRIVSGARI